MIAFEILGLAICAAGGISYLRQILIFAKNEEDALEKAAGQIRLAPSTYYFGVLMVFASLPVYVCDTYLAAAMALGGGITVFVSALFTAALTGDEITYMGRRYKGILSFDEETLTVRTRTGSFTLSPLHTNLEKLQERIGGQK